MGLAHSRSVIPAKPCSVSVRHSPFSPSAARSSPAQKLRSPAPVMRMAPTAGSFSALLKMASSSLAVSGSMALRFSSRFRVTMSTPSFSWVRTFFFSSMAIHLI